MEKFNFGISQKVENNQKPENNSEKEKELSISDFANKIKALFNKGNDARETAKMTREVESSGNWKKRGFDVEKKLNSVKGKIIEVAGPTPYGYDLVDFEKLEKPVYTSNVFPGMPYFGKKADDGTEIINYAGKVDFIADATKLPFKDGSIGAVLISCLGGSHFAELSAKMGNKKFNESAYIKEGCPTKEEKDRGIILTKDEVDEMKPTDSQDIDKLRQDALSEAFRVLESEGILIWQGGHSNDFYYAKKLGFEVVQMSAGDTRSNIFYNLVLKAPDTKQNKTGEEKINVIFEKTKNNESEQENLEKAA